MPCSDLRCGVSNLPIITSCYQCGWHWTLAGSTWLAWKPSEGTPRTVSVGDSPLLPSETTCDAQLPYLKNVHCLAQYSPLLWAFSFYTTFSASTFLPPSHPSYYILLLLSVFFFFFWRFYFIFNYLYGHDVYMQGQVPITAGHKRAQESLEGLNRLSSGYWTWFSARAPDTPNHWTISPDPSTAL